MSGSSPEAHLARTREWPNPNPNPKPNPKPNPNPNPNHNPNTILVSVIEYRPILRVSAGIDIRLTLSLYSHAILVFSDGWYTCNCCDVTTAAAFD